MKISSVSFAVYCNFHAGYGCIFLSPYGRRMGSCQCDVMSLCGSMTTAFERFMGLVRPFVPQVSCSCSLTIRSSALTFFTHLFHSYISGFEFLS